jgi:plasmid stability protein
MTNSRSDNRFLRLGGVELSLLEEVQQRLAGRNRGGLQIRPDEQASLDSMADITAVVVAQILIRQLEERVVEILRARAQRLGVSLEQSLRDLLTAAAAEQDDLRGRLAELRSQTPASGRQLDVAALIREGREQR